MDVPVNLSNTDRSQDMPHFTMHFPENTKLVAELGAVKVISVSSHIGGYHNASNT